MPTISNTICATCGVEMRCVKTGDVAQETDDRGAPYKVWSCDRFGCRIRIMTWFLGPNLFKTFRSNVAIRFAEHRRCRHTIAEAKKRAWR